MGRGVGGKKGCGGKLMGWVVSVLCGRNVNGQMTGEGGRVVLENEWGGLCIFSGREGRGGMERGVRVENGWGGGME